MTTQPEPTVALSDSSVDTIRAWTLVDEDLHGLAPDIRDLFIRTRISFGVPDIPRSECWEAPAGIDEHTDLPYLDDGRREHRLDVYLPHDAVLRRGNTLPVFVDIHGGGFTYGMKELNKNFCLALAATGFAVVSVNYRMAPAASFVDQVSDVLRSISWLQEHGKDYPIDLDSIFLTGDSAGATIAMYTALALTDPSLRNSLSLPEVTQRIKGLVLVSGLLDLHPLTQQGDASLVPYLAPIVNDFFPESFRSLPPQYLSLHGIAKTGLMPPTYLCTSSDDFLEHESLLLAGYLAQEGREVIIDDYHPEPGKPLGHVFPVAMSWLEESAAVLQHMHTFAYRRL